MRRRKKQVPASSRSAGNPARPGTLLRNGRPGGAGREGSPARLRVTKPGDLLGLVPYLLGFLPAESLVLILVREGHVYLTARVDLVPIADLDEVVDQFGRLADHHGAAEMVLFAYSNDAEPARTLLQGIVEGLGPRTLTDALLVLPDRWFSLTCTGRCCPAEGTAYDLSSHPMAAEAVFAGLTALGCRSEVEAQVKGPPPTDLDVLAEVAAGVAGEVGQETFQQRKALMASLVRAQVTGAVHLDDVECARLAVLAVDVEVRDVAWALMSRADADQHVDLWRRVVSRTTAPYEVAPLCLLGMAAWISGNGALQNCCIDRAREVDPGYSMTGLLEDINLRAVPPTVWDQMATDMRALDGPLAS